MKILYAIQGTGNGHLARAQDIVPELQRHGKVDLFVSGAQADISLPFPVRYRSKGLSFYFGKNGGIDLMRTIQQNSARDAMKEINALPITKYDLVVNDFEPISAWAARKKIFQLLVSVTSQHFYQKKHLDQQSKIHLLNGYFIIMLLSKSM